MHSTQAPSLASFAAAAALLAMSSVAVSAPLPNGASGSAVAATDKVHCYNTHICKGNSDCKTVEHNCKGQNACKGHGFKAMPANECLKKDGVIADLKS